MSASKGFDADPSLSGLGRHMHAIAAYREELGRLQASWDTLSLLGELSGNATEMAGTRAAFGELSTALLHHLAIETHRKALADLRTKAQNGINILVRNLFERTADIGFLSADGHIRDLLEADTEDAGARAALEARFREYVAKYSVYSDIILLDREGEVRARLEPHAKSASHHAILAEVMASEAAYVEHFGPLDIVSDEKRLVYAWRVERPGQRPLGVLILVFRLADEMEGIFGNLIAPDDWTVLACASPDGTIIASSCPIQAPAGLKLPPSALRPSDKPLRLGGRQYLAVACEAAGYQGYLGPGWSCIGLLPLEAAFEREEGQVVDGVDAGLLDSVTGDPALFSDELRIVSRKAGVIQRDLNRSVWNGWIKQTDSTEANVAFSKLLLSEVSNAGRKTQAVFDASIGDLYRTVIAAILEKCRSHAAFAIDVMDRNLYERANDGRWWALDATFAKALAEPSPEGFRSCASVLASINALYTVYSNLILFDAAGRVVAVSQPGQEHLLGTALDGEWVSRALSLRSTQDYAVSRFEPTALYGEAATYIYAAGISGRNGRPLGGVAIVFDSTPQFDAMLHDALPADAAGRPLTGAFALFLDEAGKVIASTSQRFVIGSVCDLAIDLGSVAPKQDLSRIIAFEGRYYAIGAVISQGYREYKTQDGYRSDVIAVCAVPLGAVTEGRVAVPAAANAATLARKSGERGPETEIATFHIARHWLGVPARDVVEAVDAVDMKPAAATLAGTIFAGYKLYKGAPVPVLRLETRLGISGGPREDQQIVIVRSAGSLLGLLVDTLGTIPAVQQSDIMPIRELTSRDDVPATGVVGNAGSGEGMLMLLDVDRLGLDVLGRTPFRAQAAE
ncbi:chemotaxis protein CheW [Bosea caraganae]|uniref:chemotaxis protein CheW n=1 Tax=Bosea caraganae TaxID=2763117 RepID=UPI0015F0F078|nr:chemotaxis protein CheW [Bosea caraganae]